MKNKINEVFIKVTSFVCTKMAFSASASACFCNTYQPEEPKCLRK